MRSLGAKRTGVGEQGDTSALHEKKMLSYCHESITSYRGSTLVLLPPPPPAMFTKQISSSHNQVLYLVPPDSTCRHYLTAFRKESNLLLNP